MVRVVVFVVVPVAVEFATGLGDGNTDDAVLFTEIPALVVTGVG